MYSFARKTFASYSAGVVFELGGTASGPGSPSAELRMRVSRLSRTVVRRSTAKLNAMRVGARLAVDFGAIAVHAPDHVRFETDDRIAPAHRAALDRFEQEAHRLTGQLQESRNRRLQVGD